MTDFSAPYVQDEAEMILSEFNMPGVALALARMANEIGRMDPDDANAIAFYQMRGALEQVEREEQDFRCEEAGEHVMLRVYEIIDSQSRERRTCAHKNE
jgi:hypothetical protein